MNISKGFREHLTVKEEKVLGEDALKDEFLRWVERNCDFGERELERVALNFRIYRGDIITSDGTKMIEVKKVLRNNVMDDEDVRNFIYERSEELWGKSFDGEVEFVKRYWTSQGGAYHLEDNKIRLSTYNNMQYSEEVLKGIIEHELLHWWRYKNDLPYGDTSEGFILEAIEKGIILSYTKSVEGVVARLRDLGKIEGQAKYFGKSGVIYK